MKSLTRLGRTRLLFLAIPVIAAVGLAALLVHRDASPPALVGDAILPGTPAPAFQLHDQWGQAVSLDALRGHPTIVTFMESQCREQCPLVAEKISRAVAELRHEGAAISAVAISTDPEVDTPASVRAFSREHHLLYRWHYLTGTRSRLAPVWHAYYVYAAPAGAPARVRDSHTSVTYLVDAQGHERAEFSSDPDTNSLLYDLRILAGLPPGSQQLSVGPNPGQPAPLFTLPTVDGGHISLARLRGKVVLLNFFATWCLPCRSEIPMLSGFASSQSGRGVVILGVDQQEPGLAVGAFLAGLHARYPTALDSSAAVAGQYNLLDLPTSFLIDRRGVVQAVQRGALEESWLRRQVSAALRGESPPA